MSAKANMTFLYQKDWYCVLFLLHFVQRLANTVSQKKRFGCVRQVILFKHYGGQAVFQHKQHPFRTPVFFVLHCCKANWHSAVFICQSRPCLIRQTDGNAQKDNVHILIFTCFHLYVLIFACLRLCVFILFCLTYSFACKRSSPTRAVNFPTTACEILSALRRTVFWTVGWSRTRCWIPPDRRWRKLRRKCHAVDCLR